jgi:uncharacterized protein
MREPERAQPMSASGIAVGVIRAYQRWVSPCLPAGTCRFHPSCSEYAAQAIRKFGLARGGGMTIVRLLRCGPWHPGGNDPVP